MANQRIKDFWINKITTLIGNYQLLPNVLDEGANWADKFQDLQKFVEIGNYAKAVCRDVYVKAGKNVPQSFTTTAENYSNLLGDSYKDLENEYLDLAEVFKTKIGVDPESNETIAKTLADGSVVNVPKWKHDIDQRVTSVSSKLIDIPDYLSVARLLFRNSLYEKIIDNTDGLPDLISYNLTGADRPIAYNYYWTIKVNEAKLAEYRDLADDLDIQKAFYDTLIQALDYNPTGADLDPTDPWKDLKTALDGQSLTQIITERDGFITDIKHAIHCPTTQAIPANWQNTFHNFFKYCLTDLGITDPTVVPTIPAGENLASLLTKSAEYSRIHTKLNGKINDTDLDNFINHTCPDCNLTKHNDYDTLKQEHDQLKTEQDNHNCDCESKVQAKETEIITKIITDLSLSTERERERESLLEAVITEIKTKITPPTDTTAKDNKISELETKLATLQSPKSLTDLPISQEVKNEVIKISQELGLTAQSCAKLESASSYQELSNLQKEAFQDKLNSEIDSRKSANYLNWGLGALSIGSLLILAYLLIKKTTFTPEIGGKKAK